MELARHEGSGAVPMPPRRVFTAPTSLPSNQSAASASAGSHGGIETLYNHPSVKIITFSTPTRMSRSPTRGSDGGEEAATLRCSSQFERTIAVGTLTVGAGLFWCWEDVC